MTVRNDPSWENRPFTEEPWMGEANCKTCDPNIFFPEKWDHVTRRKAKRVCQMCHVSMACLDYALTNFNDHYDDGIWGGTTAIERRIIRKNRRRRRAF